MPAIVPTLSHSCRIAEPPRPASGSPAQSKRKQPKTFSDIDSRTFLDFHFQHGSSSSKRDRRLLDSFCLAGLKAPIGGSFYLGQTTFLTGWFPPLCHSAISLRALIVGHTYPLEQMPTLSSSV